MEVETSANTTELSIDYNSFVKSKHPNFYVQKNTKFDDEKLDTILEDWFESIDFFKNTFPNIILFRNHEGQEIKESDLKIYLLENETDAKVDDLQKRYTNTIFLNQSGLRQSRQFYIKKILSHSLLPNTINQKFKESNSDLFFNIYLETISSILSQGFYFEEDEEITPIDSTQVLNTITEFSNEKINILKNYPINSRIVKAFLKYNRKDFDDFIINIIHLNNLCFIARNRLLFPNKEINDKEYLSKASSFFKELINNEDTKVSEDELKKDYKIFMQIIKEDLYLIDINHRIGWIDNEFIFFGNLNPSHLSSEQVKWIKEYCVSKNSKKSQQKILFDRDKIYNNENSHELIDLVIHLNDFIMSINEKKEFLNQLEALQNDTEFMQKIKLSRLSIINGFKSNYTLIQYFTKEHIDGIIFDNLYNSYTDFLSIIRSGTPSKLHSIEDLINLPSKDIIEELTRVPNKEELSYFLTNQKSEELNLEKIIIDHTLLKNFLHFYHLLSIIRVSKKYKNYYPETYRNAKAQLQIVIKDPLKEINENDFEYYLNLFFNPFNYFIHKINKFWKYEYDISAYILDYYNIRDKKGSCYFKSYNSSTLSNTNSTNTPLICLKTHYKVTNLIFFTLSHEVGHHLQYTGDFYQYFPDILSNNAKKMGKELEADMFAGFYNNHNLGLHLNSEEIKKVIKYIDLNLGGIKNFEESSDPHGTAEQRKRAYLLGVHLSKSDRWKIITVNTKKELHKEFDRIYTKSDYLRNLDLLEEMDKELFLEMDN